MKKYIFLIVFSFFYLNNISTAQRLQDDVGGGGGKDDPCGVIIYNPDEKGPEKPIFDVIQSSTENGGDPSLALDGVYSGSASLGSATQTSEQLEPYWEANLGGKFALEGISIWFESNYYDAEFKNYYILLSELPFQSTDLSSELSSPNVEYYYIESELPSGTQIPLEYSHAQYVRIQLAGSGSLSLIEVDIPGGGVYQEICGNGIDDDCDGLTDCQDSDCAPVIIGVGKVNPTCPICLDGRITVQAPGLSDHLYSLDGGETFVYFNPNEQYSNTHTFENLPEGQYEIAVTNKVCTTFYNLNPLLLLAPEGTVTENCPNGGFEESTFVGWTRKIGIRDGTPLTELNPNDMNDRFTLISSTSLPDPFIPIAIPFTGSYSVKLGNENDDHDSNVDDDGRIQTLTYSFIVDNDNSNFSFNYAMIFEDPAHLPTSANPFFKFEIFRMQNNNEVIISMDEFIANVNNPFFETVFREDGDPLAYKSWTCFNEDLSNYIGDEIFVRFTTADCLPGPHVAYAYIDGLCSSLEDIPPLPVLDMKEIYCRNQTVVADGSESSRFNRYTWTVCKVINGQEVDCVSEDFIGFEAILENVEGFYSTQFNFDCPNTYRVKLTLNNDCVDPVTIEKDFMYVCNQNIIDYKDIILCTGTNVDVQIEGINDCDGCEISWTPSNFYLDDSSIKFPTILGTSAPFADVFDQTYDVTAINNAGCIYDEETVEILSFSNQLNLETSDIDHCSFGLNAFIEFGERVPKEFLFVTFENITTGGIFSGELIDSENEINYTFQPEGAVISKLSTDTWKVTVEVTTENSSDYVIVGSCSSEAEITITPNDFYFGDILVAMPNTFTPDGDGLNDTFGPTILGAGDATLDFHKAVSGRLVIWQVGFQNVPIFDSGVVSGLVSGPPSFNYQSIAWNGNHSNGEPAISEVYAYAVFLSNCDNTCSNECWKVMNVFDVEDCDCMVKFQSDVTLIR